MKKSLILSLTLIGLSTACKVDFQPGSVVANTKIDGTAKIDTDVKTGDINADVSNNKNATPNPFMVQPIKITSVSVSPLSLSLNEEEQVDVIGTVNLSNDTTNTNIAWFSSNSSIVTVSSTGNVKA